MKALQSPLARAILRDAYLTGKHIPLHNGALFTYADRECHCCADGLACCAHKYMVHVVPKAGRERKTFWQRIMEMFR